MTKKKEKPNNKETSPVKKEKNIDYKKQAIQAMADLQNFKKRTEKEKQEWIKFANSNLIFKLLPVIDNLERAFLNINPEIENNSWAKGIKEIQKNFENILKKEGLSEINPKKEEDFNPEYHESLMQDPKTKKDKISQCLEKGYKFKDKIIRYAKVSVGSK
jgi:molecular chaperone GrpE